jgi:methyl acetate hydrolase
MHTLDAILDATVAAQDAVGVVACAINNNGLTYLGAHGHLDREADVAMPANALFYIASMTKAITSLAALQCVERGELKLDSAISEVLPILALAPVLKGYDAHGAPILSPAKSPITLRQLLTHTAGLGYTTWNAELFDYRQRFPDDAPIAGPTLRLSAPLAHEPGTRWEYSTSTDFVGLAVEAVTGLRLGEYFEQFIFAPLAMRDSFYVPGAAHMPRVAVRYLRDGDGALQREPNQDINPSAPHGGGGGLYSTATDYALFLSALLALGTGKSDAASLIGADAWRMMRTNQIGNLTAGRLPSAEPPRSHSVNFMAEHQPGFGLGFLINASASPNARGANSLAWAGLYNSYFWLDPGNGLGGALFTQVLPFADPRILARFAAFEAAVYAR